MNPLDFISQALKPLSDIIDNVSTTDEERLTLKNKLIEIQNQMSEKVLEYETKLTESQTKIITAEAQGESWLQRNWRPLLMLSVIFIVVNNYILFPYISMFSDKVKILELPQGLWTLLVTGVGGYIIGRSGEKIVKNYKQGGKE
jgi:predicted membrane protein